MRKSRFVRFALPVALIAALALVGGCSKNGGMGITSATSSGAKVDLAALSQMNEDCLQYVVETRKDGTQLWYADYPVLYLIDAKTDKLVMDPNGQPMASGIYLRKARELMQRHPDLESKCVWGVRLMRYEQLSKDGKELSRSEAKEIESFDFGDLVRKDRETRVSLGG